MYASAVLFVSLPLLYCLWFRLAKSIKYWLIFQSVFWQSYVFCALPGIPACLDRSINLVVLSTCQSGRSKSSSYCLPACPDRSITPAVLSTYLSWQKYKLCLLCAYLSWQTYILCFIVFLPVWAKYNLCLLCTYLSWQNYVLFLLSTKV